jgi:hypothetical protein
MSNDAEDDYLDWDEENLGRCEVRDHPVNRDDICGYYRLDDPTDILSTCHLCAHDLPRALVARAISDRFTHDQALRQVDAYVEADAYSPEFAARIKQEIELHRLEQTRAPRREAMKERAAQSEFQLGPLLMAEATRVAEDARGTLRGTEDEYEFDDRMREVIDLRLSARGIQAAIEDTPDILAYQLSFGEMEDAHGFEGASIGWLVEEAAYQPVRDHVRRQLGLKPLYRHNATWP